MSQRQTAVTGCLTLLEPIDGDGLKRLAAAGKAAPEVVKTVKCRTVAEGRFRHANYIRDLPAYVVDEPPQLLGDDTAPNPSEAALAALGSCLAVGIHANAVAQGVAIRRLELRLEGDINITAVWGVGDLSETKPVGFSEVRAFVDLDADAPREDLDKLVAHVLKWSPVANTFIRPVALNVALA